MKEAIFHCGRYPELTLTVEPFGTEAKAKHLHFRADPVFGAGILRINNEADVAFVKATERFKIGQIIDITDAAVKPTPKVEEKVTTAAHSSKDVRTASGDEVPAAGNLPVKAARVPGKRK